MLEGLMQHDHPLTLQDVLWRLRTMNGAGTVTTLNGSGEPDRIAYADLVQRVDRLAGALTEMGIGPGDRVASFAWNTQRHLELYLAVPCIGAVLHTINVRLFPEQLTYIANHAQDRLLFADASLLERLDSVSPPFESVSRSIVLGDEYEELLAAHYPSFDSP